MKKSFWLVQLFSILLFVLPIKLIASSTSHTKSETPTIIKYSPASYEPVKVMFDYYHHALPSTKIGNYILTGSWVNDNGRYGWNDFVHTNTFDHAYIILEDDYQLSMSMEPYSKETLSQTDIVVIMHADDPSYIPKVHVLSDEEIKNLRKFVADGGSLMVMLNAGSASRTHEGFEEKQLGKLVRGFGLDWNDDDTHYSDNKIKSTHPYFYDITDFHYGAGCTLNILPNALKPEVLLEVYSDSTYTDRSVKGPGIVMVRSGKGKFMLVGDVGSWTGNMSRPWVDNGNFLKQMFAYLKPSKEVVAAQFREGTKLNYEVQISGLQAVPVANTLSQIKLPKYKFYSPRQTTNMPFFERTGDLVLKCNRINKDQSAKLEVKINNLNWFNEEPKFVDNQIISLVASRQGKVSQLAPVGYEAQWLAPDISSLVALLPVDGLRPGDYWMSNERLRIPVLRGSDIAPVKPYSMKIKYAGDTTLDGKDCRLLESAGEIWLDELGVVVEDLLPQEVVRQVDGSPYQFLSPHGGKLIFKREQWVDSKTGFVLKVTYQTRIVAWIQDLRKPIPLKNVDKDNELIVSIAYIANYKLKDIIEK